MPRLMEIELLDKPGVPFFVSGFTDEDCRNRAEKIYHGVEYKEIEIKDQREELCMSDLLNRSR